ncbi:MAG: ATP-binding protein [Anaerolineae bacterium]|nr:ATP-binding protein [Anaerolineae bacterium]
MMNKLMLPDYQIRQRDFLLEISRAITAQLDLSEVLKRVLHASIIMLAGRSGLIALRADDTIFYVRAIINIPTELVPKLNEHLYELSLTLAQKNTIENFNQHLRSISTAIDDNLQQAVAMPLIFAGEPLGMMIVFRSYQSEASPNDMQILQSFADQAAIAVHNAQLYERIETERRKLAAILEYGADGMMILEPDLTIARFNRALERMTAWRADEAIGLSQDEVIQWEKREGMDIQTALDNGWANQHAQGDESPLYLEGELRRKDGLTVSVGITYAPLINADGKLTNIIAHIRDITNFKRAQEMQNTFISVVSHELKTPVAIIKGYAATLSRPDAQWDKKTIRDNLGVIEEEADRLNGLIQNLLTASKLQAQGQLSLTKTEVWLDELATVAVERFTSQTTKHKFKLKFQSPYPTIHADETRLRQVIDNLLSNAVKYSPEGGVIEVGGYATPTTATFYVRDSGVGLSEEDQQRIFDRFYRVDSKLSSKTQGSGLGLYLSKAIVSAHGGTIEVKSAPSRGSTFFVHLPRS